MNRRDAYSASGTNRRLRRGRSVENLYGSLSRRRAHGRSEPFPEGFAAFLNLAATGRIRAYRVVEK
ncbi:MAG: hypothetical protein KAR22_05310 [Gammaproteobacteria bacterium]|nr:hypothetical protein [Gammaproteobacteria bacterium]